ncbi:hypothetical protein VSR01_37080 [Actinacidiphila sp. DG2A-62]|jgi:UPF0716 family protein affecting phage T7 exclusion|uniref:hypothetical protein n=1 Tax=Actinacidiphila sp. DG2A-62 TaxID=3108821 RepID=UPI002DBDD916|nr:hypothetical protein [Actinacidiphila sp. DG2A-62]MEC3998798.1 hypothetical protein [Actinacidiphila sp. DG2A-62]
MDVKWGNLAEVAGVSVGATVGVVVVFALGVWALADRQEAREQGSEGSVQLVGAGACFLVCACAVLYGLYLIIPQFH